MRDLRNKVVAITGAGSGMGRAMALNLAQRGARLALSDVNEVGVKQTAADCQPGSDVRTYTLDVADRNAVLHHAEQVVEDFGQANVIINNAGVALAAKVESGSFEDHDWVMDINLGGVVSGTKAFLPHLIASGDGHIVNTSSVFGLIGVPSQSAYNAAKFAVAGFTQALRTEMIQAGHNVGVTVVHPGGVRTNIGEAARTSDPKDHEFAKALIARGLTSSERAAKLIIRGIVKNKPRVLVGPDAVVMDAANRLLGGRAPGAVRITYSALERWAAR